MIHEVSDADTAVALGSGEVEILATPRVVAWLEAATVTVARPHLAGGQTTVGTAVRVRHRRPTPVGGSVDVSADEPSVDGKKMTFVVRAVDGDGELVADGEIDRVVVDAATFGR
jgi:predicted thioesterase